MAMRLGMLSISLMSLPPQPRVCIINSLCQGFSTQLSKNTVHPGGNMFTYWGSWTYFLDSIDQSDTSVLVATSTHDLYIRPAWICSKLLLKSLGFFKNKMSIFLCKTFSTTHGGFQLYWLVYWWCLLMKACHLHWLYFCTVLLDWAFWPWFLHCWVEACLCSSILGQ